jgi:hypothetical protein
VLSRCSGLRRFPAGPSSRLAVSPFAVLPPMSSRFSRSACCREPAVVASGPACLGRYKKKPATWALHGSSWRSPKPTARRRDYIALLGFAKLAGDAAITELLAVPWPLSSCPSRDVAAQHDNNRHPKNRRCASFSAPVGGPFLRSGRVLLVQIDEKSTWLVVQRWQIAWVSWIYFNAFMWLL